MPIDLHKPIGAPSAASSALPTKKSINLLVRERKHRDVWKYVLAGLVLAALVALFAKFAVLDVFKQLDLKKSELYAAQQELAAVQAQLNDYDSVVEEYRSYTGIASEGAIDALRVFDMVAKVVQPKAEVTAVGTSGGVLIVNVKGTSLDELGALADALRSDPLVESVSFTTATDAGSSASSSQDGASGVSASLSVVLAGAEEEGEV